MILTPDMRERLFGQLARVSGFGVRGIGLTPNRTINGTFGFSCVLYAGEQLADLVLNAPKRAYHEQLIMIYRKIVEGMEPHTRSGHLRFCKSEPLTLAMNKKQVCSAAGVRYKEDYFHVPPTNFAVTGGLLSLGVDAPTEVADTLDNWGRIIGTAPFFAPDDPDQAWISLALLPSARVADISDATFWRSVTVTQFGWGLSADSSHDPELVFFVDELKSAAHEIETEGWIRTL